MTQQQAYIQAQQWWGPQGSARFIPYKGTGTGRYTVGMLTPERVQYGTSRLSFEAAFENAREFGHGPKEAA